MVTETAEAPIETPIEKQPETVADKLTRALAVCGEVGRLYKRRGNPPKWIMRNPEHENDKDAPEWIEDPNCGSTSFNRDWKRGIILSAWRNRPAKHVAAARCTTCGAQFVGSTLVRCQCPTAKPQKQAASPLSDEPEGTS